ncbi:hypothetical protein [Proteiniphilum sp.]|uniref:hypothetical protein n=1 Tax=Proteiniphilum sp. TaxID=1926877 RepID=UPI002B20AF6D|nr:hypothetical protein [Proteiniphilum sp.]MEA4918136.1 hypothetical protein [Proteiniphilum sp.]
MITTKINIKPHLKEYVTGRYNQFNEKSPVRFPDHTDIYILIWDLLVKRPADYFIDEGNLEIVLPDRYGSKPPEYYNYLGARSQKRIERKIQIMMWADFREFMEIERSRNGSGIVISVHLFMKKYGITSISEDALIKSYYRWRNRVREREKRSYFKQANN